MPNSQEEFELSEIRGLISDEVRRAGTVRCLARASPSAVPPTPISPPLVGTEQANTHKVCGRILRRVAAGFGEDIAPGAASAWGQGCRGRQGHRFGDSSSAARSFTIKAMN
jgi:hypothetical protein